MRRSWILKFINFLFIQFCLIQGSLFRAKRPALKKSPVYIYNMHDREYNYNVKHMIYIDIKIENVETM